MQITSVMLKKEEKEGSRMKAKVTVVVDNSLKIHGIRVVEGNKGLFVAMPSRKNDEGKYLDVVHPVNNEVRKMFEDVILEAYNNAE